MQNIYKKIYLYLNDMFNFCNIFILFVNTIIYFTIFLHLNILAEEQKIVFNQFILQNSNTKFLEDKKNIQNLYNLNKYLSRDRFIKKIIVIKKNSNFFNSAYKSGLPLSDINDIIKSMRWQINFKKIYPNSTVCLIFKIHKINTKKNNYILLGIKFNNGKRIYYAIRAINGNFYDINGLNKSKMLMNFELLKNYRISSCFDLNRIHPIKHNISKHLGIDLAMPEGTFVFSTSNGKITKTAFDKISGYYIVLNNDNQYITKYMHLKKILVQVGQNIKINQKIALSGNTGQTTGPHLHYEIWIKNHAINPLYAEAYFIKELTKKEKILYFQTSKIIISKLK